VTLNDRLDYFGTHGQSRGAAAERKPGGDIVLSEAMAAEPGIAERLALRGAAAETAQVKGFAEIALRRIALRRIPAPDAPVSLSAAVARRDQLTFSTPIFMLQGKIAIVTGSTSGIGLGIASALAAEGCDVMLNGFGDPAAIADSATPASDLAGEHGVRIGYSPADMSKPADIREMVARRGRPARRRRHPRQQCRHPACREGRRFPRGALGRGDRDQPVGRVPRAKAALPHMLAKGWGRIINIASAHGLVASGEKAPMSPPSTGSSG
jgi:hypothetical protein